MKYKVGDKVKIKTWQEMVDEFGLRDNKAIDLPALHYWDKSRNAWLPKNNIIIIINFKYDYDYIIFDDSEECWVHPEMIKCSANEYYLQQIKDELYE